MQNIGTEVLPIVKTENGEYLTVNVSTQLRIPTTIPKGTYYVCEMADSTLAVTEGDESNNTRCTTTTVTVQ